jgi:predicted glycoside hydrolase/deacetylase ChbG (UPF0249 family)
VGLTVVLHADDFGLNRAVTEGILRGFTHGLLTSTSVLANAPYAAQGLAAWQELTRRGPESWPSLALRRGLEDVSRAGDIGVHLNLTQGRPLTGDKYPAELLDREGRFPGVFSLYATLRRGIGKRYAHAIRDELAAQIARVVDHGVRPTHLNGHQYVELIPVVTGVLFGLLSRFSIPAVRVALEPALARTTLGHGFRVREWMLARMKHHYARQFAVSPATAIAAAPECFFGTAHAGRLTLRTIDLFLSRAGNSRTMEIGMHPGFADDRIRPCEISDGWHDPLAARRPDELALLESPRLAERLRGRQVALGRLAKLARPTHRKAA